MKIKDFKNFIPFSGLYDDLLNKPAIIDISSKQDTLISGSNIKTINSQSLMGDGNLVIEGGTGLTQQQIEGLI